MAERRMFAKSVVLSDAFLDLPAGARCLYFSLGIQADDDGFVNSPSSIMRMCGACPDDMRLLVGKGFLIRFDSGVVAISHWRIHNFIPKDRYKPTLYKAERSGLVVDRQMIYRRADTDCIQNVDKVYTQDRLGKDKTDKVSLGEYTAKPSRAFAPPTLIQIMDYCQERGNQVDAQRFLDHYCSNGWMVGKTPMRDWKAAVRGWERNGLQKPAGQKPDTIHGCTGLGQAELEAIQAVLSKEVCDVGASGDWVD